MSLKIKTHKFESRVAPAAQRRPFGRKAESRKNEEAEIKDKQYYLDMFDKAYKECVQLDIDNGGDGQEWAQYFATGDDPNYFSQKEAEEIVGYYMEFHPNWEGETDRPYQDWLENMNLANGDNPPTKMDREVTRILKALYAADESKKSEATSFGAGMSKRTDLSKMRNLGEVIDVLEEHKKLMENKAKDLSQSKEDLQAAIKSLNEFSKHVLFLKQQSVKGIKDALTFNKSPEVKAAADIEKHLKNALKILYSDYENIPDVTQLLTVVDSRYATRGDKVVTAWVDNATRAIEVDAKTIKDSIAAGDMSEDDVVKLVTVTYATHGVKNKDTVEKVTPVLERMNALLASAPKIEEAVIDPKEFKELRDLVEQIVKEASEPTLTVKTAITTLSKGELATVPSEAFVSEGLLDKLKDLVASLKDKISSLWNSFTSLFFNLEDEALESAETFAEVEEGFAIMGIVVESYVAKRVSLGKQFEVLTKSVLHCCDKLVKDASLAGEFDDEVIYAEEAVNNAVESFQALGEACKTLKNALSYHKNEDNMNVIGILADAITQIVNDDNGGADTDGGDDSEDDENSVIRDVEKEYSPAGGEGGEEGPEANGGENEAPNPAEMGEPEPF